MKQSLFARWQANFWAGLAIVLPAVISIGILVWIFRNIANITDTLLIFLPRTLTHENRGEGVMFWYWSLAALFLAVILIGIVGLTARNYFGKKMIEWVESGLMRVPLLNKIYAAIKQVNEAFSTGNKTSFRTVVMVEYPRAGAYSMGFITGGQHAELEARTKEKMVSVFIPTTPNPTSGFMILVPEEEVTKLDMSVAEGIKYVISLGAISPDFSLPVPEIKRISPAVPLPVPAHD